MDSDEEIKKGILVSTLHSTLQEYKDLGILHEAALILAKFIAPDGFEMSVFMTKTEIRQDPPPSLFYTSKGVHKKECIKEFLVEKTLRNKFPRLKRIGETE